MTPVKASQTRAEATRRRRAQVSRARKDVTGERARRPASAPTLTRIPTVRSSRPSARSKVRRRYQVSVPFGGRASLSLPSLHIQAGPRAISAAILLVAGALLAVLWYVPPFVIESAQVNGAQRLGASDINSVLAVAGKPLLTVNTKQLEQRVRAAFPEIRDVSVTVGFPADLKVTLSERTPVVAWQQGDQTLWLDSEGFAFPPRGTADGLITVKASAPPPAEDTPAVSSAAAPADAGAPPQPISGESTGAQQLLTPDAVTALQAITPYVPQGSGLIYDPAYGLGWTDARGWQAYFGQSISDLSLKLQMYQTMVQDLASRGIQPTLISVEYPDAPFYRAEH
jgi:cell division protein FtsQ